MSNLHKEAIVFDGLIVSNWSAEVFQDMVKGGVTAANCTCCVWEGFQATMNNIADWKRWFREHDDLILQVFTTADIDRAKAEGRTGSSASRTSLPSRTSSATSSFSRTWASASPRWPTTPRT